MPTRILSHQFPHRIRERGRRLLAEGRLLILDPGPPRVRALAAGTRLYELLLEEEAHFPTLFCSCPAFARMGPCKHLWALLLLLQQRARSGGAVAGEALPEIRRPRPRPVLLVDAPHGVRRPGSATLLPCRLHFLYEELRIPSASPRPGGYLEPDGGRRVFLLRDRQAEAAARRAFARAGGRLLRRPGLPEEGRDPEDVQVGSVAAGDLDGLVRALLAAGWQVEAEGQRLRHPGSAQVSVRSGVDWFDLEGGVDFGGVRLPLPELLAALRRHEDRVLLGDGSVGLLPREWLRRWGLLASLVEAGPGRQGDAPLRLQRNRLWALEALAGDGVRLAFDPSCRRLRRALRRGLHPRPEPPPPSFRGGLRPYQELGLGWLRFLEQAGLGGCLADDMGLGKTVQVLAHLLARREDGRRRGPSLVVVPRSLVHNWLQEAARFTPDLRCLDYTGPGRAARRQELAASDLALTTYGTLRRDVAVLRETTFDLVVLDEAQAIKNPYSQTAAAARALRARYRLALSGTPVENHLGELWSLFEFLNPGMLGQARVFRELLGDDRHRLPRAADQERLGAALRPFFLRRTKEQVLPELPPRTETLLECELRGRQRGDYEALRRHYRQELAPLLGAGCLPEGGGPGMVVLEALLRLRQAACHPGLLDPTRRHESSAKLDVLLEHLRRLRRRGHKALVFSQFRTFLDIVRQRLRAEGLPHAWLDGTVHRRAEPVRRFQEDPDCSFFLVSLKAGGTGLNLTAADYVFLLDPWWNPAAERQAVDRAHRIGQQRPVLAYRLLCRGTVEEKVLLLQERKRQLAEALFGARGSLLRELTRDDLELLLS